MLCLAERPSPSLGGQEKQTLEIAHFAASCCRLPSVAAHRKLTFYFYMHFIVSYRRFDRDDGCIMLLRELSTSTINDIRCLIACCNRSERDGRKGRGGRGKGGLPD